MKDRFKFRFLVTYFDDDANEKRTVMQYSDNLDSEVSGSYLFYCDEDVIIQQSTGLKDKNGKLIYEGDIVRSDEYPFNSDGDDNYYAEICFDNETASFFYYTMRNPKLNKVRGASTGNTGTLDEHIFKIIGNIYENKDLLNA